MLITELLITMEIWKDIEGYEGLYRISSNGVIKSLDRVINNNGGYELRKGRVLKTCALTASKELHISRSTIIDSIKGKNTRKYKWAYKEDKLCA